MTSGRAESAGVSEGEEVRGRGGRDKRSEVGGIDARRED